MASLQAVEVEEGERFAFGKNWQRFLATLSEARIVEAEKSLTDMLGCDLAGRRFLDVGSGSGLFSLAARRLGARVHSFDYDPQSVACTRELRRRFSGDDPDWVVEEGSVLNAEYMASLGELDVVYSWGVLHHTGDLWRALANALKPLAPGGLFYIAIYNQCGFASSFWRRVKKTYCSGFWGRVATKTLFIPYFAARSVAVGIVKYGNPWKYFTEYRKNRGMSIYTDWIDWLGGYPFEVAKPEEVFAFCDGRGLVLRKLVTTNGSACNQFVFQRATGSD